MPSSWSEGNDLDPVGEQQCRRHSGRGRKATGGAVCLEQTELNVLGLGNGQHHGRPPDKLGGDVVSVTIHNPGRPRQDPMAIAIDQIGRWTWGRQATQLFGADGDPEIVEELLQAGRTRFALSIVSRTQSGETGADQTFFSFLGHGIQR